MATGRPSKQRRDREKAKQAKAAEKRLRRQSRGDDDEDSPPREPVDEQDVIRQLADLNASYEGGDLDFEDFDLQRAALLESLTIE